MSANIVEYETRCQFCGKLCATEEIVTVIIGNITWLLCPFCNNFATVETATQVLNNVHPNNIEKAYGAILSDEWEDDNIDYI